MPRANKQPDKHVLTFRATADDKHRMAQVAQALMNDGYDVYHNGEPSFQKLVRVILLRTAREIKSK